MITFFAPNFFIILAASIALLSDSIFISVNFSASIKFGVIRVEMGMISEIKASKALSSKSLAPLPAVRIGSTTIGVLYPSSN